MTHSDPAASGSSPDDGFRARLAEERVESLSAELTRTSKQWRIALLSVVLVSLLAILMLGVVAFNAVD